MEKRRPSILVVDDEEIVLSLVTDALDDEDYDIITASSSSRAVEYLESQEFDLLLTDIRMPVMDGIELAAKGRELRPDLGVIFMTGYANLNSAKDAIKQGAVDYIMKPFELMEIRQSIQSGLEKVRAASHQNSDEQLKGLSDLSTMLFSAGDRKSLIISSLKFAMMNEDAECGSALFQEEESGRFCLVTIEGEDTSEISLSPEPLTSCLEGTSFDEISEPKLCSCMDHHPMFSLWPEKNLRPYFCPTWMSPDSPMTVVPVTRSGKFHALLTLASGENRSELTSTHLQFLAITSGQLAITLENLALLQESREAYSRLEELQDNTIELEKMATRGEMSAEIGHELNNFLGVIAASISLLDVRVRKQGSDDLTRYTANAMETIEKIKVFTSNLMELQPIATTTELLNLSSMIPEIIQYLVPQRRFRNVRIEIDRIDDHIGLSGDGTQIHQLLYNLFNNAADATQEKGNGRINISVESEPSDQSFIIRISDNGIGFEPKLLEKAFHQRFTTKRGGHGFGLVVCNRIIENHGGKLKVDSVEGEGTILTIKFPLAEVAELEPVA